MAIKLVEEFVNSLGWEKPVRLCHTIKDNYANVDIEWYECGTSDDLFLQINAEPVWRACVFSMQHQICSGWHDVHCFGNGKSIQDEVERLTCWLHYSWFETEPRRQDYLEAHPVCANISWETLREAGAPSVED